MLSNCDNDKEKTVGKFSDSRRAFLKIAIGALAFLNAIILGIPILTSVIRSARPNKTDWSVVGNISSLGLNVPQKMNFSTQFEEAYLRSTAVRSVWVIKDDKGEITVFSPICTHLGCYFTWNGETAQFECPCHASVFSVAGKVLGGPAPRSLDRLPLKVENGMLFVRWEEFKSGTSEKVGV